MSVKSISLSASLDHKIGSIKEEKRYSSRSEVIRDALRGYLSEYESLRTLEGEITYTTTAIYSHRGHQHLDHDLLHMRYTYDDIAKGSLHMHVKGDNYAEIFITQGNSERVLSFIQNIRILRGIEQIKYSIVRTSYLAVAIRIIILAPVIQHGFTPFFFGCHMKLSQTFLSIC